MPSVDISKLRNVIKLLNLRWEAGETSVSNLDHALKEAHLGALLAPERAAQYRTRMTLISGLRGPAPSYPQYIDWRTHQRASYATSADWTTFIKDQGACGACVSFAVVGAMESVHKIHQNDPTLSIDLSEAFLFFCGGGNCEMGWDIPPALDFSKNPGVTDEDCFRYPDPAHQEKCDQRCQDWSNRLTSIKAWQELFQPDQMKAWISSRGPVIARMEIYDDFYHYLGGVYAHAIGDFFGYHAVTVVGYDNDQHYWICKNSWGTGWGEQGWFKIRYKECGIDTKFPMYTVEF